jgi:hypothetical protein
MKKAVVFIVVIALLSNCAYNLHHYRDYKKTRPIVISPQVGETIDLEEREKFDLFHGIEDFKSAMFYGIPDGGYEVEIITEHSKLIAVNRDTKAIPIMRNYIDRYEEIKDSTSAFEEKWEIVDYDDMGQPITRDEVNRVKGHGYRIGCCVGGCLLGLIPSAFLGLLVAGFEMNMMMYPWGGELEHPETGLFVFIAGLTVSAVLSALLGNKFDRSSALKAIKMGRQPRVAGHF